MRLNEISINMLNTPIPLSPYIHEHTNTHVHVMRRRFAILKFYYVDYISSIINVFIRNVYRKLSGSPHTKRTNQTDACTRENKKVELEHKRTRVSEKFPVY